MTIKASKAIKGAFSRLWDSKKKANKTDEFKTSGFDNADLWAKYLNEVNQTSEFWYDMVVIQTEASLRNVSARELTFDQYNPDTGLLRLIGVKCQRAEWTKETNNNARKLWLKTLKHHLRSFIDDPEDRAVLRLAESEEKIFEEIMFPAEAKEGLKELKSATVGDEWYKAEYNRIMGENPPAGHEYTFTGEAKAIMDKRYKDAVKRSTEDGTDGYLFPAVELGANRNAKDAPVSRQSCLRSLKAVWQRVFDWAMKQGGDIKEAAELMTFGLHSFRKTLVKILHKAGKSLEELSKRLGHADSSMVFNYINESKKAITKLVTAHKQDVEELGFKMGVAA